VNAALVAFALLFVATQAPSAGQTSKNASLKVDRLCGTLARVNRAYDKHDPHVIVEEKRDPLAGVTLRLYPRRKTSACCDGSAFVEEIVTGRRGQFMFKKDVEAGDYWLAAETSGKEYKLELLYEPMKAATDKCADFEYQVSETGEFSLAVKVVVD
jgi:hypothetical protein